MSGPDSDVKLAIEHANEAWDLLAEKVDALLAAWDAGTEPALGAFLPAGPAPLRHLILVELIKVDQERRWLDRHSPKLVEDYLAEFPELAAAGQVPADLIYEEFHIRRQAGEAIDALAYFERFPQQAAELGRLLGYESKTESTILTSRERAEELKVGDAIDDFDLLLTLGKGAFATVYLARQRSMQRLVALKISSDKGAEPQTLAQLDHPHIVRVFDQRQVQAQKLRRMIADDFQACFKRCDVIAGPVAPTVAWKLGAQADDPVKAYLADIFTLPASLAGLPGMSVPAGFANSAEGGGMPVGLQLIGNYFAEGTLLNAAHALQQATDWHQQEPRS